MRYLSAIRVCAAQFAGVGFRPEVITLILRAILLPFVAAYWIFIFWVLWIIAKSLKSVDESLKEISRKMQGPS